MSIPGFAAEASVYRTHRNYRAATLAHDAAGAVYPSQGVGEMARQSGPWGGGGNWWHCWNVGGCYICCSLYWCWWVCYGYGASAELQ
jgi:hypothetical protein